MEIQIKKAHAGNLALETDRFDLPIDVAQMVTAMLCTTTGPWWFLRSATRTAVRRKQATVKVFTSGFGSQQLINTLSHLGHTTICTVYPGDIEE